MKLLSFEHAGRAGWGVVVEGGVVDTGRLLPQFASVRAVLAADAVSQVATAAKGKAADYRLADLTFLPPIRDPAKIICIGLNYEAHRVETKLPVFEYPVVFTRWASSHVANGQPLVRPKASTKYDYEGELVAVIGKPARHVGRADALKYIAGYSIYNDGSIRDFQRHSSQFIPGKNFPETGAFGPWLVTADEIPDPSKLTLVTRLNGAEVQRTGTDDLIFDVPALIEYCSGFTRLEPGDLIVTGTPGGVGYIRKPPLFMKGGDTVEVEISGIGTLSNPVRDE